MAAASDRRAAWGRWRLGLALAAACGAASAAEAPKAPPKAVQCAACHGPNGIGTGPAFPNLAGQKADYLVKALRDFRSGKRQDEVMSVMAKGLTSEEIDELAQYYEALGQQPK